MPLGLKVILPVVVLTVAVPFEETVTTMTVAGSSALSASVSLANTSITTLVSSIVMTMSFVATGASFTAVTVMFRITVEL